MARPSYWLKVDRAEEHLVDLKKLVAPYNLALPCRVDHTVEGKNNEHVYRMWPDESLDPRIAILLGEFLFNLRSALDHLRASLVPRNRRRDGYFPILTEDIWERDPVTGDYLDSRRDARSRWDASVKGMDSRAVAQIDDFQPFRHAAEGDVTHQALAILSRLNNADKHRELVPTAIFADPAHTVVTHADGRVEEFEYAVPPGFVGQPGAVVHTSPTEVEVQVFASKKVTLGVEPNQGLAGYAVLDTCEGMVVHISRNVIPALERYVLIT